MARKPENERAFRKANPNNAGRPCKLTPEITETICGFIMRGAYIETAAICAGITKQTFYTWMKQANEHKTAGKTSDFTKLLDSVEKAMANSELKSIESIHKAAEKNWFAAAWRLERQFPKRWALGKREEEVNDENKPTTEVTLNYSLDSDPKNK